MTTNRCRGQARVNSPGRGAPSVQARRATRRPRRDARQFRVLIWLSVGNGIVGGARRPSPDVSVDVGREFDDANQRVWKILDVQRRQGSPPLFLYAGLCALTERWPRSISCTSARSRRDRDHSGRSSHCAVVPARPPSARPARAHAAGARSGFRCYGGSSGRGGGRSADPRVAEEFL